MSGGYVLNAPFSNIDGVLAIDGLKATDLVQKFGSPVYVTSKTRLEKNFKRLHEAFSDHYPRISIKFAVKANSNPNIINVFQKLGGGADVSNFNELLIAKRAGIMPDNILMSPNNLGREELYKASREGVIINFDDITQLELVEDNPPLVACFRVNPGVGKGEFPGTTTAGPNVKFGIPEEKIVAAYRKAKELGIKRFGIQMMTGSNVLDPEFFGASTSRLLRIASKVSGETGIDFEFIDIGGGFGVPYRPGEVELDLQGVAKSVSSAIRNEFEPQGKDLPILFLEPGRLLAADSTVLLASVTTVKSYGKIFVGTDAGMNTLLRPALYGAYHPIEVANRLDESTAYTANIVGQICESTDRLGENREIPEVKYGDIIAVFNAGAYGYSMSNQFNGHGRAAEVMISNGNAELIRRAETVEDLLSNVV